MPVFKIKSMDGNDKTKVVHPSDHTNVSDTESMDDQTVNTHGVVAASAVTSHVQSMSAYSRAWVASLFQQGLQFVTTLFE